MRKFMLIVVSVVLTMFLAREARAQQTHYDYTYYTNANSYVCAVRAPFGEVHIIHSHPVTYHMCRQHYRHFLHNYPAKLFHFANDIYYTHWDQRLTYNTHYLNVQRLLPRRYYNYYPRPSVTFQWNGRILPRTTVRTHRYNPPVRTYSYNPPVRRYTAPERQRRTTVTYGTTRTSRPPQERRTVRSETTTRRRTTTSNNNSNRRRSRDGNRERRRR